MKTIFTIAALLCGITIFAGGQTSTTAQPLFNWNLLWSGSWEENKNLHNRTELRLHLIPTGLTVRGQILDRRPMDYDLGTTQWNPPWGEPEKAITHFTGGLYHRQTGSRLLYGVIDEFGLSARIRNVWLRSPPYTENNRSLTADLRISASGTREDEVYLHLSSPFFDLSSSVRLRTYFNAQTQVDNLTPLFLGGLNFTFPNKTRTSALNRLTLETLYTTRTLPPTRITAWFSDPPRLPERDFHLYAGSFHFSSPSFALSSDFALSQTFAWGEGIYSNLGITFTPLLSSGRRARPLTISLAADGAEGRFVNRDGVNLNEGFRGAAKIDWRGSGSSMLRVNSVLRSGGFGETFNRSSSGIFYHFPVLPMNNSGDGSLIRFTRISLSADRNAENSLKINDSYSGSLGLNFNPQQGVNPIRITLSGSIKGFREDCPYFYPIPAGNNSWNRESTAVNCEFFWSWKNIQLRSRVGITVFSEKEEKWDFSASAAVRFRQGRLSLRAAAEDFPEKWNWTISWRLEKSQTN